MIGQVTAKASATISATSIDQNSAQRRLSTDLADALNKLSGVSVSTSSDDSDATQTISLEGHDPTQTQLTLDGIPLNAPGSAGNLGGVRDRSLSRRVGAHGADAGRLGRLGQLQHAAADAELDHADAALDGQLRALELLRRRDGLRRQARHRGADRAAPLPQPRRRRPVRDASGLDYVHDGDSTISGNMMTARYEFGDTNSLTRPLHELDAQYQRRSACAITATRRRRCRAATAPTTTDDSNVQLYSLTDNALLGATQLQASVFSLDARACYNQLARYVNGEPSPNGYSSDTKSSGYVVNATLPAQAAPHDLISGLRHVVAVRHDAAGAASLRILQRLADDAVLRAAGDRHDSLQRQTDARRIGRPQHRDRQRRASPSLPARRQPGGRRRATPTARRLRSAARPRPKGGCRSSAIRPRCASIATARSRSAARPANSRRDSSSNSVRVSYTHELHGGNVSLTLYRQVQNGVLLPVYVNGDGAQPARRAAAGLSAASRGDLQLAGRLQRAAYTPFTAQQLYMTTPIAGVQRVYQGAELTGFVTLGNLVVQPYYNLTGAVAELDAVISSTTPIRSRFPASSFPTFRCKRQASCWTIRRRTRCSSGWPTRST